MNKTITWVRQNTVAFVALLGVFLVGALMVNAYSGGSAAIVVEDGGVVNVESLVVEAGGDLAGVASFISAGTNFTDVNITNDLLVDGDAEVTGTLTVTGESQFNTVILGGSVLASSTTATVGTLTAAQICDNSVIEFTPNATGGLALTLPSTSTLFADCLSTDGDSKSLILKNATSTAETDIILTAGTGNVLVGSPTTTAATSDTTEEDSYVRMVFTRLGNAVGEVLVELVNFNDTD